MTRILKTVLLLICLCSCRQHEQSPLQSLFNLPKKLKEVSGITYISKKNAFYTIEDSGNENVVYELDSNGKITAEIPIEGVDNTDWEDITTDADGNVYLGDFGNNDNKRTDLAIYKIQADAMTDKKGITTEKISFYYPEQTEFPPKKSELFYDAEGFIYYKNYFYVFTKNRSKHFDGTTLLYRIPATAGHHKAELMDSFKTGENYNNGAITSAAISPDETKIALLSHSKIWLFEGFSGDSFFKGTVTKLDLQHYSQKEAVTFKSNTAVFIADEKVKKSGGNVYEYAIPE
ncbi:SdiA-regulated domain-containing protein [Flavobacterium sp.]|uniref:SdiA-regulated domain-containing protein n=1 Tax=Flavobacterium sp. TaxID=239 RepID=UPI003D6B220C